MNEKDIYRQIKKALLLYFSDCEECMKSVDLPEQSSFYKARRTFRKVRNRYIPDYESFFDWSEIWDAYEIKAILLTLPSIQPCIELLAK